MDNTIIKYESEISQFLNDLYAINSNAELIVGISRQSWLNNFGKIILKFRIIFSDPKGRCR